MLEVEISRTSAKTSGDGSKYEEIFSEKHIVKAVNVNDKTNETPATDEAQDSRKNNVEKADNGKVKASNKVTKDMEGESVGSEYICIPRLCDDDDDDDDDWEDEDKDDEPKEEISNFGKPASDFPDHLWIMTRKGEELTAHLSDEIFNRDQDAHDQYFYNDFSGYGFQEVVENHLLSFDKVMRQKEPDMMLLWAHVESAAIILPGDCWYCSDDSDGILATLRLIGVMVMTTLHFIKSKGELKPDSKVRNIIPFLAKLLDVERDWPGGPGEDDELSWTSAMVYQVEEAGLKFENIPQDAEERASIIKEYRTKTSKVVKQWSKVNWKTSIAKFKRERGCAGRIGGNNYDIQNNPGGGAQVNPWPVE